MRFERLAGFGKWLFCAGGCGGDGFGRRSISSGSGTGVWARCCFGEHRVVMTAGWSARGSLRLVLPFILAALLCHFVVGIGFRFLFLSLPLHTLSPGPTILVAGAVLVRVRLFHATQEVG